MLIEDIILDFPYSIHLYILQTLILHLKYLQINNYEMFRFEVIFQNIY